MIINNKCPWKCVFNFFNHKNLFRPIWSVNFCKFFFLILDLYFDILTLQPILNLGPLLWISLLEPIYEFDFTSISFILIVLWYISFHLLTIPSNLYIFYRYRYFLKLKPCIHKFHSKVLMNLSITTNFPSFCVE